MGLRRRFSGFRDRLGTTRAAPEAAPAQREPAAERPGRAEDAPRGEDVLRPRLVVGLGNPGPEYSGTRHNIGAWCIERLAARHGGRLERDKRTWHTTIEVDGRPLHLARPRTYYNESGGPVTAELRRLHLERSQLLVVYDEIDLPLRAIRMRPHGGHGGNNGMRSVLAAVGGNDFPRVRIGIDRPYDDGAPVRDPDRVAAWVLAKPGREERALLDAAVEAVADAIELAVREGVHVAMSRLNLGA